MYSSLTHYALYRRRIPALTMTVARRGIPSGAVKRLHEYANGIRVGAGRSVTSQSDG